jgi:hypothetical protein
MKMMAYIQGAFALRHDTVKNTRSYGACTVFIMLRIKVVELYSFGRAG